MTRVDDLASWHHDWSGLRVAVLGLGVTGFAAVDTLAELGAAVTAVAERVDDERRTILGVLDVPIGTVMSRLHRGRKKIREQLMASGFGTPQAESSGA